jgi:hypothetical protein
VSDGHHYLRQTDIGHFELCLLGMGLLLAPVDFLILVDIVQEAARQVQNRSESRLKQFQQDRYSLDQLK